MLALPQEARERQQRRWGWAAAPVLGAHPQEASRLPTTLPAPPPGQSGPYAPCLCGAAPRHTRSHAPCTRAHSVGFREAPGSSGKSQLAPAKGATGPAEPPLASLRRNLSETGEWPGRRGSQEAVRGQPWSAGVAAPGALPAGGGGGRRKLRPGGGKGASRGARPRGPLTSTEARLALSPQTGPSQAAGHTGGISLPPARSAGPGMEAPSPTSFQARLTA